MQRPVSIPDDLAELMVIATASYERRLDGVCSCDPERCVELSPSLDIDEARCVVSMLDERHDAPVYRYYETLLTFSWDLMECMEENECAAEACLRALGAPDALLRSPSDALDPAIRSCHSR